ncbi:MAG: Lipid II flippase FtsW [Candidatus Omnitrophica bacterium ADurb.Bin292]|nr:MAG: Lipid II flippase FtsW [Candidatus Omnitrophica bacterium ADurb.Bin292]HPW76964.1 putative lipid II flippase FtsW [Candidatus Omnitrophota bacterium]HQB11561.1 putative lipid II flippase FtsW [Candidatus Omnitrophota bacterium]
MSRESRILFIVTYLLVAIGVVMIYSSSAILAHEKYHNAEYFLCRQIFFVLLGTVGFFVAASLPVKFYKNNARVFMLLAIFLLLAVYLPGIGRSAGGARRWIYLVGIQFQPVEFAKLACCIYLADYLSRKIAVVQKGNIGIFVPPMILTGILCLLTILEPDLGSTALLALVMAILFFLTGIRLRYVVGVAVVFAVALYALILTKPYRMSRMQAYLNPWQDPQGSGFQIIQSFLAFALGGLKGVGLGESTQKLFYLPSSHNDFILSVIAEEMGLLGVLFVTALYAIFFICCIRMTQRANQPFEKILITALMLVIILQTLIHMMVATGLVPTKGLPLPFVSYGGSSIVLNLITVGVLIAVDRRRPSRGRLK